MNHNTNYLYCEFRGKIIAVLPLAHVKSRLFGNALISTPFLVNGGCIATDTSAERMLVEEACAIASRLNVDYLEIRNKVPKEGDWPRKTSYVSFSKPISPDPEENLLEVPRKQRAMIRKAIKADLRAELDDDVTRLHSSLSLCKRNLGTPFFNKRYLQDICETFDQMIEITTVTKNSDAICSVMSFRFRNEILPYYGGGGQEARALKGNDFMYWSVMKRACLDGVQVFDFGRSMVNTGSYRFKKHWGFEPTPLNYEFYLVNASAIPKLEPSNPRYQRLIKIWSGLPLVVTRNIGPHIARLLG